MSARFALADIVCFFTFVLTIRGDFGNKGIEVTVVAGNYNISFGNVCIYVGALCLLSKLTTKFTDIVCLLTCFYAISRNFRNKLTILVTAVGNYESLGRNLLTGSSFTVLACNRLKERGAIGSVALIMCLSTGSYAGSGNLGNKFIRVTNRLSKNRYYLFTASHTGKFFFVSSFAITGNRLRRSEVVCVNCFSIFDYVAFYFIAVAIAGI